MKACHDKDVLLKIRLQSVHCCVSKEEEFLGKNNLSCKMFCSSCDLFEAASEYLLSSHHHFPSVVSFTAVFCVKPAYQHNNAITDVQVEVKMVCTSVLFIYRYLKIIVSAVSGMFTKKTSYEYFGYF